MTYAEKKALLASHPREKQFHLIINILNAASITIGLYGMIRALTGDQGTALTSLGFLSGFIVVWAILSFGIGVWVAWGMYRLERWVTMILWIFLVLSALSLNLISVALIGIMIWMYRAVLKVVYPTASVPPPPTSPAQKM